MKTWRVLQKEKVVVFSFSLQHYKTFFKNTIDM